MRAFVPAILAVALPVSGAMAGPADVVDARAFRSGDTWRFEVTVRHADEGWSHYADHWEVVAPDGTILGERPLAHPHVNEMPFTRALHGVAIPPGITSVTVRARDNVHGHGGATVTIALDN